MFWAQEESHAKPLIAGWTWSFPSKVEGELTRLIAGLAVRILASMARKGAQRTESESGALFDRFF